MSREEETRTIVKGSIVRTPESKILEEIAISLGMIVDILKKESVFNKIIAEIQMKIEEENYGVISDHTHEDGLEEALEIIEKYLKGGLNE